MAVGASAQYAHFFPQKTYKQMNFINQNTSKLISGQGMDKKSFLFSLIRRCTCPTLDLKPINSAKPKV